MQLFYQNRVDALRGEAYPAEYFKRQGAQIAKGMISEQALRRLHEWLDSSPPAGERCPSPSFSIGTNAGGSILDIMSAGDVEPEVVPLIGGGVRYIARMSHDRP